MSETKTCGICGRDFHRPIRRPPKIFAMQKYCSVPCYRVAKLNRGGTCSACGGPARKGRTYCSRPCYIASRKMLHGAAHPAWIGGRSLNPLGYMTVHMPVDHPFAAAMRLHNGRVLEHRLVMAEAIGRALTKRESVHHRNGDRSDNRIENLELWAGKHGSGSRTADSLGCEPWAWAKFNEVIRLTPPSPPWALTQA